MAKTAQLRPAYAGGTAQLRAAWIEDVLAPVAGLLSVWNGTLWVSCVLRMFDGVAWQPVTLKRWSGVAWTE